MSSDLITMLAWSLFLLAGVGASAHLYRHLGVLTASQASIMSLAALLDTLLLKRGMSPIFSWLLAVVTSAGLGIIHVLILLQTRTALLLLLTAISQLALVEVWYAVPQLTGGSSGMLLPRTEAGGALFSLVVLMVGGAIYLYWAVTRSQSSFNWACVRTLGPKAEAFGVPSIRLYTIGFAVYGVLLGACGVAATRLLGYLTISSFGLGWALATVMIVLAVPRQPVVGTLVLCLIYSAIHVLLRQSVYASVTASAVFEILFPLILLALMRAQDRIERRPDIPTNVSSREA